jgi:glycosyltransferase involved in cell wall biosynthesis
MNKMNRKPEISVVMPVYNGEMFLKEAMESILNQTYNDFEFLIVYDESIDGTLSIIKDFQEQDTRVVLINGNKEGISGALNKGIKEAKGKYIARMDCDDISLPIRFEKQISHMQNLELDICGGHQVLIDSEGTINGIGVMPRSHDLCGLSMMFMIYFAHSSVMIRKSFLTDYSLQYKVKGYFEDFDLWARMFSAGAKFGNVDDIVIRYRVLDVSLSTIHAKGARRYNRMVLKRFKLENKQYLLDVIKHINLGLLSEIEKSIVARYFINKAITRLEFLGLYRLRGISFKTLVITLLSEIQRLLTKNAWLSFFK